MTYVINELTIRFCTFPALVLFPDPAIFWHRPGSVGAVHGRHHRVRSRLRDVCDHNGSFAYKWASLMKRLSAIVPSMYTVILCTVAFFEKRVVAKNL
jgi:hypothetical protein